MNNTVLITGASSGIGQAFASVFASHGYNLVLVARNEARLNTVAAVIRRDFMVATTVIVKDLGAVTAAQELFDETIARGLQIDILINNAGAGVGGNFIDNTLNDELAVIQLNVITVAALCHLFGTAMANRQAGRILNVASIAAFLPGPLMANYYASKAYVLQLSVALRCEFKHLGVTVTTLCPGPTQTELFSRSGMATARAANGLRMQTAEQVAVIGYLALMRGKGVVVTGVTNKLLAFLTRLAPRSLLASIARAANAKHPY